jgi:hypothetical protein
MIKASWKTQWDTGKVTACQLRNISRAETSSSGYQIYLSLGNNRKHIAWIARLRTGHCGLNQYLGRFKIKETRDCDCGNGYETVKHYLLTCTNHEEQRIELRKKAGERGMTVERLLGDKKLIKHTLEFVEETNRFEF